MATDTAGVPVTTPTDVGLRREMGLIGATWASETSIIGSGWLFGALLAAQAVGGAAVLAWAGHIHFWWDMLVTAAFSLAIYYWAMRTKLPREEMLALVNKQA